MSPNPPARSQRPHLDGLGGEGLFEKLERSPPSLVL